MEFREKVVMLTGAGKGVGRETAKHFAGAGARVGLIARTQRDIQSLEKEIRHSGGQAMALCCDISQEEQVDAAVKQLETAWGGVDILVNNAAVFRGGLVEELSLEDWHYPIRVILDGTFLCCKHVLPGMKRRKYGKIVNIASSAIQHAFPGYSAYAAAKGGVVAFAKTLTEEVRAYGINVNTIILGLTNTAEVKQRSDIPAEKMLQPAQVANTILYLSSDQAKGFQGAALEFFGDYL
ncbi:MAG: SDR family oxidoreductase [Oscillospiraceae bacterium]|nr:SDR family oxidoreductase [Oscillospiraceae bacterium]